MKLYTNHKGELVIDGAGNLVLSKNEQAIKIDETARKYAIVYWTIWGCNDRLRTTWEALKWIWLR